MEELLYRFLPLLIVVNAAMFAYSVRLVLVPAKRKD